MRTRAGIYLGYVGHQNLGDEAMWQVCRERLTQVHWSTWSDFKSELRPGNFARKVSQDHQHLVRSVLEELRGLPRLRRLTRGLAHRAISWIGSEVGLLGGGTLVNISDEYLNAYRSLCQTTGAPVPVFGAGVASPEFWSVRSDWTDRRKEWVALFESLPYVGVRGPHSKALLDESGARNVIVVGDPAVCFHRPLEAAVPPPSLSQRPPRIAVNCGDIGANPWGTTEHTESVLVAAVRQLLAQHYEVVLFAVCPEDLPSCHRIAAQLPSAKVTPLLASAATFLEEARSWSAVVSLKLHAAVLAAAANIPFISLAYRPKCLDFAASIEWEPFAVRINQASPEWIVGQISAILTDRSRLSSSLCFRMCSLSEAFERYCLDLENLLTSRQQPIA